MAYARETLMADRLSWQAFCRAQALESRPPQRKSDPSAGTVARPSRDKETETAEQKPHRTGQRHRRDVDEQTATVLAHGERQPRPARDGVDQIETAENGGRGEEFE